MNVLVCIPWRDRGKDQVRAANVKRVFSHWLDYDYPVLIASDGREGDDQFNRSLAYNRGAADNDADMFIFAEADMLIDYSQIDAAIEMAYAAPGLVVPFTVYHALAMDDSKLVRDYRLDPVDAKLGAGHLRTAKVHGGAINVISRETYDLVGGYDEQFSGNGYDDDAFKRACEVCCGPTRWVEGPAYHLWHQSAWEGRYLTAEDRKATARNRARFVRYQRATTPEEIRALTCE